MDKFGRNYFLSVQTQDNRTLEIQPPFTIEFDITRNTLTSANVCSIRVFNLSQNNRNKLRKDIQDVGNLKKVQLKAGYGSNLPIIFNGNISQCWSAREGTNFITSIECFDAGFAFVNGHTDTTFPAGTSEETIFKTLIGDLPDVSLGVVASYPKASSRAAAYSGNTADILREITGEAFFVDNGKAYVLRDSECLLGEMLLINSQSGLLGTPVLEQTVLTFDMIFEPRLLVGQKIQLESSTGQNFNGFYKIISLKHRGMISPSVCGDAVTSAGMWYGIKGLTTVAA